MADAAPDPEPAESEAPNDPVTVRALLAAIDDLRDPAHALGGLAELAAEQAQSTAVASIVADVEREVRRITSSIGAVLDAAASHRRVTGSTKAAGLRVGADVLVVDDNAVNQALTAAQLRQLGLGSDMAMSGEEALDYLQTRLPKVVLMDWHMVGMDGLETTERIRAVEEHSSRPRVPIVGLTAQAMTGDRERCFEVGMDGFLAKPVPLDQLQAELERWI